MGSGSSYGVEGSFDRELFATLKLFIDRLCSYLRLIYHLAAVFNFTLRHSVRNILHYLTRLDFGGV
jgi:hypothetical protein